MQDDQGREALNSQGSEKMSKLNQIKLNVILIFLDQRTVSHDQTRVALKGLKEMNKLI